jgi:hypothetical protein
LAEASLTVALLGHGYLDRVWVLEEPPLQAAVLVKLAGGERVEKAGQRPQGQQGLASEGL